MERGGYQISHNKSLDGILDQLNSGRVTDAGPLDLIDNPPSDDDDPLLPLTTAGWLLLLDLTPAALSGPSYFFSALARACMLACPLCVRVCVCVRARGVGACITRSGPSCHVAPFMWHVAMT